MTQAPQQPTPPDLNFELSTPQVGDTVCVSAVVSDPKRMLSTQIILPWPIARELAQAILKATGIAEKQIVKPPSLIDVKA